MYRSAGFVSEPLTSEGGSNGYTSAFEMSQFAGPWAGAGSPGYGGTIPPTLQIVLSVGLLWGNVPFPRLQIKKSQT